VNEQQAESFNDNRQAKRGAWRVAPRTTHIFGSAKNPSKEMSTGIQ